MLLTEVPDKQLGCMVGRAKYSIKDVFIGWVAGDGLVGKVIQSKIMPVGH